MEQKLITGNDLLAHWQSHRKLTRKTIETFPEDKLFTYSLGGMRTYGEMVGEMLGMEVPVVKGLASGTWETFDAARPEAKADLLAAWDKHSAQLSELFVSIPTEAFVQAHKAFGQWEMPGITLVQYAIDNQIHHRGQGYVYLRALGVEPPAFWDRS